VCLVALDAQNLPHERGKEACVGERKPFWTESDYSIGYDGYFLPARLTTGFARRIAFFFGGLETVGADAFLPRVAAASAAHWAFWRAASMARWMIAFFAFLRSMLVAPCSPHFPAQGKKTSG